jgi:hypothetical protein
LSIIFLLLQALSFCRNLAERTGAPWFLIYGVLQLQIDYEKERRPMCDSLVNTPMPSEETRNQMERGVRVPTFPFENEPFFGHGLIGLLTCRMESKGLTRRSAG